MLTLKPGEAASLLIAYKARPNYYLATSTLVAKFQPIIEATASQFPSNWKEDLIQEGNIALVNTAKRFPETANPTCFLNYAYQSIKRSMLYFLRSTISRTPKYVESLEYIYEEGGAEMITQIPHPIDYQTSTTLAIDFKYNLGYESMKRNHFSEREIKAFDLHLNQGYNVSEVAKKINLSISQTSKIISKTKTKVQQLLG